MKYEHRYYNTKYIKQQIIIAVCHYKIFRYSSIKLRMIYNKAHPLSYFRVRSLRRISLDFSINSTKDTLNSCIAAASYVTVSLK